MENMQKPKKLCLFDYTIHETLGSGQHLTETLYLNAQKGAFGKVKLAQNKRTHKWVAIKMLQKYEMLKNQQIDHIINEVTILANMNHPFIVTYKFIYPIIVSKVSMEGYCQNDQYFYIVLEFASGGELFTYLRKKGRLQNDSATLFIIYNFYLTIQLLCWLSCFDIRLPSLTTYSLQVKLTQIIDVLKRDLKPENLMFDQSGYLKLTDFGFAKVINSGRTYTLCGTPEYLAPEILLNKGHGTAVDWWTLGIFIYELNAGIDPFSDDNPMMIYQKILSGTVRFPKIFDPNAKSLVRHLVQTDLSKRYGVDDVKNHRWFKQIDWDQLYKCKLKVPYQPNVSAQNDTSNFLSYPESESFVEIVKPEEDPFLQWA